MIEKDDLLFYVNVFFEQITAEAFRRGVYVYEEEEDEKMEDHFRVLDRLNVSKYKRME